MPMWWFPPGCRCLQSKNDAQVPTVGAAFGPPFFVGGEWDAGLSPLAPGAKRSFIGLSAHRRGDVAAIDRGDIGRGAFGQGLVHESLGDVFGRDLKAQQIAGHVVLD